MLIQKYKITDKLLNHLLQLETDKTIVSSQLTPVTLKSKLERRVKVMNLFHLSNMLGLTLTIRDAEKLVDGRRQAGEDNRMVILNNFRNVMEFNRSSVAQSYSEVDVNLINHLNKLILTDWHQPWEAKMRSKVEQPSTEFDNWVAAQDKKLEGEILNQVNSALDWYRGSQSLIFPIIRIAILWQNLVAIAPYLFANKLTSLALADFLLYRAGYSSKGFISIVRAIDSAAEDSWESLVEVNESGEQTKWLERLARNLSVEAAAVREEYLGSIAETEKSAKQPFLDLNRRQLKVLRYLQTIPTVRREDYCQMMDVSTMTAFRDLSDLVTKKLLKVEGQGRGTKYMLSNR